MQGNAPVNRSLPAGEPDRQLVLALGGWHEPQLDYYANDLYPAQTLAPQRQITIVAAPDRVGMPQ